MPGCSVPQATEESRQHQVAIMLKFWNTISSQRDVHVVAKPRRERNVPAPPELGNVLSKIRISEVSHQMYAKELGRAGGNFRKTRKIAIDLKRETDCGER